MRTTAFALLLVISGCSSAYYGAMEQLGIHKREILVDRVGEAREAQIEAKDQFASALEQFRTVVAFDGGDLEKTYDKLNDELERSEGKAEAVRERIAAVEDVADALFKEWEDELDQYSTASLRQKSERQLSETRRHYAAMIRVMQRAESRIDPVLDPFRDQVLYLKHNLNARAIASLQGEAAVIEADVDALIRELEQAIAAADTFINQAGI